MFVKFVVFVSLVGLVGLASSTVLVKGDPVFSQLGTATASTGYTGSWLAELNGRVYHYVYSALLYSDNEGITWTSVSLGSQFVSRDNQAVTVIGTGSTRRIYVAAGAQPGNEHSDLWTITHTSSATSPTISMLSSSLSTASQGGVLVPLETRYGTPILAYLGGCSVIYSTCYSAVTLYPTAESGVTSQVTYTAPWVGRMWFSAVPVANGHRILMVGGRNPVANPQGIFTDVWLSDVGATTGSGWTQLSASDSRIGYSVLLTSGTFLLAFSLMTPAQILLSPDDGITWLTFSSEEPFTGSFGGTSSTSQGNFALVNNKMIHWDPNGYYYVATKI